MKTTLLLLFAVCGGMLSVAGAESPRPNILLIVSEDNGPELGCYGDRFARTPNLDRLAAQGVRFQNAFVTFSVCSPSRASFLTGLPPHQNGQIGLATHKFALYRADTPNVATLFQAGGYHTGLIGKLHVNPESAFPFDFRAIPGANFNRAKSGEDYASEAARFWRESNGKPWFLSVNYPDAHLPFLRQIDGQPATVQAGADVRMLPWVGVESPRLREVMADYYNCLARLDDSVGRLLRALEQAGAGANTLVIYLGDHGAQFPRGKGSVYEAALRVPLILKWPGQVQPGLVREELISTVDLLPTALHAARLARPDGLPGLELQPLLQPGRPDRWREHVFAMTTGAFPRNCYVQHSVRDKRYKLIVSALPGAANPIAGSYLDVRHPHWVVSGVRPEERTGIPPPVEAAFQRWEKPPRHELYDLQTDPYEWHNLADSPAHSAARERLLRALNEWRRETRDPFLDPANVEAFVKEQRANTGLRYRTNQSFHWSYLDSFPKWMAAPPTGFDQPGANR